MITFRLLLILAAALLLGADARLSAPDTAEATFPGANGRIVYARNAGAGQVTIHTVNPDGSDEQFVTDGGAIALEPAWSPDGSRIAFTGHDENTTVAHIGIVNADGTGLTYITRGSAPTWSPDGQEIAFACEPAGMCIIDVETAEARRVNDHYISVGGGKDWSPDGSSIAHFDSLWPADGGEAEFHTGWGADPSWSPDGTQIVSIAGDILMTDVAARETEVLLTVADRAQGAAFSPDGRYIVYSIFEDGLYVMNADGTGSERILEGTISLPEWGSTSPVSVEFTQGIQELQTIPELQADLQGDGQPPVPLVADKQGVMRIYFGEVQEPQSYTVELSGQITATEDVTIEPGCTTEQRRSGALGCESIDYLLQPPAGDWSVRLVVKDFADDVVLDEEFAFISVETDGLKVAYLPICVRLTPGAAPTCPSNFVDTSAPDLMRKLFPAADNGIEYERLFVPPMVYDAKIETDEQKTAVTVDLRKRYDLMVAAGSDHDQLAGWLPVGGVEGTAGRSDPLWLERTGRISWQMDQSAADLLDPEHTLAHEIAHNLGLRHTHLPDACGAEDDETTWPYPNSTIQEVGYDVFDRAIMPDTKKDIMTYCTPPGTNIWISPFSYNQLLEGNFLPQSVGPAGAPQQFLIISGTAQADGSAGTLDPAYVITSDVQPNRRTLSAITACA